MLARTPSKGTLTPDPYKKVHKERLASSRSVLSRALRSWISEVGSSQGLVGTVWVVKIQGRICWELPRP